MCRPSTQVHGRRLYPHKIPLLPYIRPLHRKWSLARVFSSAEMDRLFISQGMELLGDELRSATIRTGCGTGKFMGKQVFVSKNYAQSM